MKDSEASDPDVGRKVNKVGALVFWLWEETHVPKVVSLNPGTLYWMDIFSHLFVVKIVMCV